MDSENIHSFQKEIPIPALDMWLEQDGHNRMPGFWFSGLLNLK